MVEKKWQATEEFKKMYEKLMGKTIGSQVKEEVEVVEVKEECIDDKKVKKNEVSKRCNKTRYQTDEEYRKMKIQKALERYHATKQLKGKQSTNPYYLANAEKIRQNALERYHSKKVKEIE